METVYIGVGSNLGDPLGNCTRAIRMIGNLARCHLEKISHFYIAEPLGSASQPWYVNAAIEVKTRLTPFQMLDRCNRIEIDLLRTRIVRWAPRTIDLDILLWKNRVIVSRDLCIPHRQMQLRRFVLKPLCDICPDEIHPVLGFSIKHLLQITPDPLKIFRMTAPGEESCK